MVMVVTQEEGCPPNWT